MNTAKILESNCFLTDEVLYSAHGPLRTYVKFDQDP
jgi:hypothetical protein